MPQDVSPYIPEIWARQALIWLRNRTIMARLVHRDFENEVAEAGDTVNAHRPQTFTAQDVTTPITPTALNPGNVAVLLDQWKHVTFAVSDNELAWALKAAPNDPVVSAVIRDHIQPAASALAEAVDSSLLALYADIPTTVGAAGVALTPDTVVDAGTQLNVQKVPAETRYMVISAKDSGALLKTEEFTSANWDPANVDALRTANIGPKYGFGVIAWTQLVETTTSTPIYQNLAFHRDAFALVVRPLETPAAGTIVARAADPESGLSVRLEIGRSITNKRTEVSLDILYGVKTLNADLAVRVLG